MLVIGNSQLTTTRPARVPVTPISINVTTTRRHGTGTPVVFAVSVGTSTRARRIIKVTKYTVFRKRSVTFPMVTLSAIDTRRNRRTHVIDHVGNRDENTSGNAAFVSSIHLFSWKLLFAIQLHVRETCRGALFPL